jgi:hypothetical protein
MATALASTAAATAVAGGATIPAGLAGAGIDVVDVRVEDLVSISATGAWKPLLALQVTVPAGTSANLLVRYTAATQCHGSSCSIRMRLVAADGSTRMLGAGRFAAPVARGASMVETAEFVAANVDAGSYWVRVDGFVAGVEVGFSWFENQVLVVEQVRAGGRPASEVRPVVATQAAIADPFDASIADPRWQTGERAGRRSCPAGDRSARSDHPAARGRDVRRPCRVVVGSRYDVHAAGLDRGLRADPVDILSQHEERGHDKHAASS